VKALEAGKHVLCEKPLSRHPDEVAAAFDAADRTGRLLSEAFMWRHNPQTARMRELIDQGAIGELRLVRSTFSYSLYDETNIRLQTEVDGGSLMDVGCYNISGSRFVAGSEPERVFGEAWYGPTGTDWVFAGTMRFPNNVIAAFDCGTATSSKQSGAKARCSSTTRGTASAPASSCGVTTASSGSRSSRRTPTGSSSRT
jgi:predicted dehydrogenase